MHASLTTALAPFRRQRWLPALALACAAAGTQAQNLIQNPGNELPLVNGHIPGWTTLTGTNWTQRGTNPAAQEGSFYFFAGPGPLGKLQQDVDVSSLATAIDAGQMAFGFSGWVRSFDQSPVDTATIGVSLLDASSASLLAFDSGPRSNTASWQEVTAQLQAPVGTRTVRITLTSTRSTGVNNDGYFDNLSLVAAPVPEPGTAVLLALGGLAGLWQRATTRARGNGQRPRGR